MRFGLNYRVLDPSAAVSTNESGYYPPETAIQRCCIRVFGLRCFQNLTPKNLLGEACNAAESKHIPGWPCEHNLQKQWFWSLQSPGIKVLQFDTSTASWRFDKPALNRKARMALHDCCYRAIEPNPPRIDIAEHPLQHDALTALGPQPAPAGMGGGMPGFQHVSSVFCSLQDLFEVDSGTLQERVRNPYWVDVLRSLGFGNDKDLETTRKFPILNRMHLRSTRLRARSSLLQGSRDAISGRS